MVPFRREKGIVAAAIGIASSILLGGERSVSAYCNSPTASNCFAYGKTDTLIIDGAAARFDVRQVTTPDWGNFPYGHTNQTLWLGVQNSRPWVDHNGNACSPGPGCFWGDWCEIGWTKGGFGGGGYTHYYAFSVSGVYNQFQLNTPVGNFGVSHHYEIVRQYDGLYKMYIDLQEVADCYANPFSLWARTGLEYTYPTAKADTNNPRSLQWRDTNLNWHDWGSNNTPVNSEVFGSAARWSWVTFPTYGADWTTN